MLKKMSHSAGVQQPRGEILFTTRFGYLFPELAKSDAAKLPVHPSTVGALKQLGNAMADIGTPSDEITTLNSNIPAVFTYLGQFIDHDITARTDRDTAVSRIGDDDQPGGENQPLDPDFIVENLFNGRRPQLDLDSVYGDGPGLLGIGTPSAMPDAEFLYDPLTLLLTVQEEGTFADLPRVERTAQIGDMRNDENVIVSQLHAAFLKFHNAIAQSLSPQLSPQSRYSRARQLVRWAYQYVVVHDYLKAVCAPAIVEEILLNGPRFYRPGFNDGEHFMPLEFSVAGFRFGHSMIRPFYQLNPTVQKKIMDILEVSRERPGEDDLLEQHSEGGYRLKSELQIDWENFVQFESQQPVRNLARRIDPLIAKGLFNLGFEEGPPGSILAHLAQRNLLRGFNLSIPTGQAIAKALGYKPLGQTELIDKEDNPQIRKALQTGGLIEATPLWFYVLREAAVQTGGNSLGVVGSTIVAETLIGLVKLDPNSYLNNGQHPVVEAGGIRVLPTRAPVASISDILEIAGVR